MNFELRFMFWHLIYVSQKVVGFSTNLGEVFFQQITMRKIGERNSGVNAISWNLSNLIGFQVINYDLNLALY